MNELVTTSGTDIVPLIKRAVMDVMTHVCRVIRSVIPKENQMETTTTVKDWIPFLSSLITPIFVILLILWFRSDVVDFLGIVKKAVGEQERSIEIGDWIKIGERARTTEISNMDLGDISVSLEEHDYEEWVIEKGDESLIYKLREQSEEHGGKPVDVMILKEGIRYSSIVLEKYVCIFARCKIHSFYGTW